MPIIPATWEAKAGGLQIRARPGEVRTECMIRGRALA
jgi:hypothetical protein